MDRRVLPLLLALSGLSHPSPEPQQKFPEDFYSGSDSNFEHPITPDEVRPPSGSFSLSHIGSGGPSSAHGSSAPVQSNVDLRHLYHSIMNPARSPKGARQHAGYTHIHAH